MSDAVTPIPLVDLGAIHEPLRQEFHAILDRVLTSSAFSLGPEVATFEESLAAYVGAATAIGCGSGTSALQLALIAAGIGHGDEVILPANTFFATAEAVVLAGAKPVLVDVDPATANIDPAAVAAAINPATAAAIMVHLYGQPADADAMRAIANRDGLFLLEDAAQAIGASWNGTPVGSLGDAAAFSFYAGKNLGALGEAGAITTDDDDLAAATRMLRVHGQERKYYHDAYGFNERMDGLQGAFLDLKLRHLPEWQRRRDELTDRYLPQLADIDGVTLLQTRQEAVHVRHLLVVRVANRDRVLEQLDDDGVGAGIHYPVPIHLLPPCHDLGQPGEFPVTEALADSVLSLPLYPGLRNEQVDYVCAALSRAIKAAA